MRTKKVPCITAAAGAPWTSFVSAVDEVARTTPSYRILSGHYPDTTRIAGGRIPGYHPNTAFSWTDTVLDAKPQ